MQHDRLVAAASKYQKNIWEQRHLQEHVPVGDQIVSPPPPQLEKLKTLDFIQTSWKLAGMLV